MTKLAMRWSNMQIARKYCSHDGAMPEEHECCGVLLAETEAYETELARQRKHPQTG